MPKTNKYKDTLYNANWLRKVYVEDNQNAAQVAALIGCQRSAVHDALKRFGIPVKGRAEAQVVAEHDRGSSAPRPRGEFKDTLHNPEWMAARVTKSHSEIAREVGASPNSVMAARRKFAGTLPDKTEEEKKAYTNRIVSHKDARLACPPDLCVVCGDDGEQVNHIDRDWQNNDPDNLERICITCHRQQHGAEAVYMIHLLKEKGISYRQIWKKGREMLLSGEYHSQKRAPASLTIDGVTKSTRVWAEEAGIPPVTLRQRLVNGWDPKEAVTTPRRERLEYEIDGVKGTISEHCQRYGVSLRTALNRINQDWDIELAVRTPYNHRGPRTPE